MGGVPAFDPVYQVFDLFDRRIVFAYVSENSCLVGFPLEPAQSQRATFIDFPRPDSLADRWRESIELPRDGRLLRGEAISFCELVIAQVEDIRFSEEVDLVNDVQKTDLKVGLKGDLPGTVIGNPAHDRWDRLETQPDARLESSSTYHKLVVPILRWANDDRLDHTIAADRTNQRAEVFVIHTAAQRQLSTVDLFYRNFKQCVWHSRILSLCAKFGTVQRKKAQSSRGTLDFLGNYIRMLRQFPIRSRACPEPT